MKYLFLLFLIFNVSCATMKSNDKDYPFVEQEFVDFVHNFQIDSKGTVQQKDMYYLQMEFADLPDNIAGVCYPNPFGVEIQIDRDYWCNHEDYVRREQLIYHELGHCVLLRMHIKPGGHDGFWGWLERLTFKIGINKEMNLLPDGCPTSYMDPYLLDLRCINSHYDYYIEELYHRADVEEYKNKIKKDWEINFWDGH